MFQVRFHNVTAYEPAFETLDAAKEYIRKAGFEGSVWRGDALMGDWSVFGGWKAAL